MSKVKKVSTLNYVASSKEVNRAIDQINKSFSEQSENASSDQSLNKADNVEFLTVKTTSNGQINNIKVGDDAFIGDGNVSNCIVIKGQQNQTIGLVKFGPGQNDPIVGNRGNGKLNISTLLGTSPVLEYADNAAAVAAGLLTGDIYRTGDLLKIVH